MSRYLPIETITSNKNILGTDGNDVYIIDATNNDINVTLPDVGTYNQTLIKILRADTTSNVVTILPYSGQTINGLSSVYLYTYGSIDLFSYKTNWIIETKTQNVSYLNLSNQIYIDKNGNDTTGARNGKPFLTISAGLAVAQSGDVVYVNAGTYNETIIIPSGVTVKSNSLINTTISYTASSITTLVTMGTNCLLKNFTLSLTASTDIQLTGILFPSTSAGSSIIKNCKLVIDNSSSESSTQNIIGILSNGTGTALQNFYNIDNTNVNISTLGSGLKRGIYVVSNANTLNSKHSSFIVNGGSDSIGAETNVANSVLTLRTCVCSGSSADISQTNGTIQLNSTNLVNSNANGKNFNVIDSYPKILQFQFSGSAGSLTSKFIKISDTPTINESKHYIYQNCIVKNLYVSSRIGPGIGNTDTYKIKKTNSIGGSSYDTSLVAQMSGTNNICSDTTHSVTFLAGSLLSVFLTTGSSSQADAVITLEIY